MATCKKCDANGEDFLDINWSYKIDEIMHSRTVCLCEKCRHHLLGQLIIAYEKPGFDEFLDKFIKNK